ncbi:4-hydroxythreonine-4-phosphate dehydrogenase PdxA [Synoicihabitans lomoniglobus]|uniref:4-hydroxythreonine-4-phosphate dehydrogenase PdxA n=1 Tax=Synoicihabitans lomoniglobus TaxID=2909285 RepID=A0AAF0I2L8_9BACT|nr:4-hydroxythreonine-4-phosphate dehydrogenase PdxA [Opitutaceae bacterium LMO-M01]WED65818.1 4-hydroxythreonine-4-phosphate dehydrogenase PdxA [Opitutaceae bacterium LMO-M01]
MKPLAFTCGDPAGVGPEIIAAWLAGHPEDSANVVVIGPADWLDSLPGSARRIMVGAPAYRAGPGEPDDEGAELAWAAMQLAAEGCAAGQFSGVVTGPVSKARLAAVGYPHPGQTEFFAEAWGGDPVMAFRGDHLRLTLATWHIPLREVSAALSPAVIERAVRAAEQLARADGIAQPRIAVCGLNPHAGEGGVLGREEIELIDPLLDHLRGEIPGVSHTLPADTVFGRALKGDFDAVVALYHDQGLGPLKTIDFDNAVNVTLGLPHVRTSPDHGTGFDIAGQGTASATSFARAVELARRLAGHQ